MGIQRFGGLKVGYLCWVLFSVKRESGGESERRKQNDQSVTRHGILAGAEQRKSILVVFRTLGLLDSGLVPEPALLFLLLTQPCLP